MKFFVPNYSCLQNPWLGGYRPQIPALSLSSALNWICWTPLRTEFLGPPLLQTNKGSSAEAALQWQCKNTTTPLPQHRHVGPNNTLIICTGRWYLSKVRLRHAWEWSCSVVKSKEWVHIGQSWRYSSRRTRYKACHNTAQPSAALSVLIPPTLSTERLRLTSSQDGSNNGWFTHRLSPIPGVQDC